MKKIILLSVVVLCVFCCACRQENGEAADYGELEQMEEVTIEGNCVTIILPEDQALPHRWEILSGAEGITLQKDFTVKAPYVYIFAQGSSPAFRVLVLELSGESDVVLHLANMWLYSEDVSEANGTRVYEIEYSQTGWTLK